MITIGSLFSGIGGLEKGLEDTGEFKTIWQVENNKQATEVLTRHWPNVDRYGDIRECHRDLPAVDLVCGGDPCPKHGNARRGQPSRHPDLSGYFLAVVGRLCPRWVVRENVPAPTMRDFAACLEALGYGTVVVRIDAANFTSQSRTRDFVVARYQSKWHELAGMFPQCSHDTRTHSASLAMASKAACLTTNRTRYNTDDNYIFDSGRIRILEGRERARLAGFPDDWAAGFSESAQARFYGNAVCPAAAGYIGERIEKVDRLISKGGRDG